MVGIVTTPTTPTTCSWLRSQPRDGRRLNRDAACRLTHRDRCDALYRAHRKLNLLCSLTTHVRVPNACKSIDEKLHHFHCEIVIDESAEEYVQQLDDEPEPDPEPPAELQKQAEPPAHNDIVVEPT